MKASAHKFLLNEKIPLAALFFALAVSAQGEQRTFATPADATNAFFQAAQAGDCTAIHQIFGPHAAHIMRGDSNMDCRDLHEFATNMQAGCSLTNVSDKQMVLEIGQDHWPFPVPLVKQDNGLWFFDTVAGEDEIINRHIGSDEFYAIGACRAYVKAQQEYGKKFQDYSGWPKYARDIRSHPGQMDGLCWAPTMAKSTSPLPYDVAAASVQADDKSHIGDLRPYHGYFFKVLTRQGEAAPGGKKDYLHKGELTGGFALVAYPAHWGKSGVMTFIVNQDGIVYQHDFGEKTTAHASHMKEYDPEKPDWTVVQEEGVSDLTVR